MKILLLSLLLPATALSQQYTWEAPVDTPRADGFHRIELTPEVTCQLNERLTDIRLYDQHGTEVPYLSERDKTEWWDNVYREHPIVERIETDGLLSGLIIGNPGRETIDNLYLEVKNADVRKRVRIRGSMDGEEWYAIKEDYLFHSFVSPNSANMKQMIRFPKSDYRYFKLEIDDYWTAPLFVLSAGYYDKQYERGRYLKIPEPEFSQLDSSDQSTWVALAWANHPHLDMIQLDIDGPAFYHREVEIKEEVVQRNGKSYFRSVQRFTIGSNQPNTLYLDNFNQNKYWLVIRNQDNPVLTVNAIHGYQVHRYLTAHMEGNKTYVLRYGRTKDRAPVYDLEYFRTSIPSNPAELTVGPAYLTTTTTNANTHKDSTTIWIWTVIGIVAVALGAMSFKMIREMNVGLSDEG